MEVVGRIAGVITDALRDPEKMPGALIVGGVLEAAAALSLLFFRVPGGVFSHPGGNKALLYVCYVLLAAVLLFGLAEVATGFWVSRDSVGRRDVGTTVLWFSIVALVVIVGLGGGLSSPAGK
ncbi:unnamed protein product [Urochloa humidicola]